MYLWKKFGASIGELWGLVYWGVYFRYWNSWVVKIFALIKSKFTYISYLVK